MTVAAEADMEALFRQASALLAAGRFADAADAFGTVIAARPDWPTPYNNLAVALRGLGRLDEALLACAAAIGRHPDYPEAHANLARLLIAQNRHRDAALAAERATELRPDHGPTHALLALALLQAGAQVEALPAGRRALSLDPASAEALAVHAQALRATGHVADAVRASRRLATLDADKDTLMAAASLLAEAGEREEAVAVYRRVLAADPDDVVLAHLVDAMDGTTSAKAPERYVSQVFDSYADRFDDHLVGHLGYRAHEMVAGIVAEALPAGTEARILDAGCGTGLCGPLLRPVAERLVGVDLSARMLAKAGERGVYDALVQDELARFLNTTTERFEAIVSADVLCYVGDLRGVFQAATRALSDGGLLAFTVERQPDPGFRLTPSGRYAHGLDHVRACAQGLFRARGVANVILRTEASAPVHGYLCLFQKRRSAAGSAA